MMNRIKMLYNKLILRVIDTFGIRHHLKMRTTILKMGSLNMMRMMTLMFMTGRPLVMRTMIMAMMI
uniref:Uncharacterized protein n=1 Tax=Arundo donax TaxID=35708 RepID=A0A0A9CKA2_ARUDO